MKVLKLVFVLAAVVFMNTSCTNQVKEEGESTIVSQSDKVEVYYFHFSRRCATCNAVESVSKEAVTEYYGDKVNFVGVNLDEEAGEALGKALEVSGQTLLIVDGETKIDITSEGFMNARSNPDTLKAVIKEKIDPLL